MVLFMCDEGHTVNSGVRAFNLKYGASTVRSLLLPRMFYSRLLIDYKLWKHRYEKGIAATD